MSSKINDLRTILFDTLDRLNNKDLSNEQLKMEVQRANSIFNISKAVIETTRVQLLAVKIIGDKKEKDLLEEEVSSFTEINNDQKELPATTENNGTVKSNYVYKPEGHLELT